MSNFLQSLGHLLPNQVTLSAVLPNLSAGGSGVGDPSYFDLNITDSSGILNGSFDAFCIDTDRPLGFNGFDLDNDGVYNETRIPVPTLGGGRFDEGNPQPFSATVYSSYDSTILADGLGGLIEKPENLDLVNWILNNTNGLLAGYTTGEIQMAIWELMDNTPPSSNDVIGLNAFFGGFDRANVDAIKAVAQVNGEGFVPQAGEKVAIILVPDGNDGAVDGAPDGQIIITAVELARLGDTVFEDLDADGIQDAGEVGIAGARVNLLADVDGDGVIEANEIVDTTTTDANGQYHFTVLPGEYKVQFETPDGFDMASPVNQGSDDTIDSNGPVSDVVSLDPGEIDSSIDAGFFKKAGLGDFVFNDADGDGVQDAGENGIAGVLVKLQNPDGSAVVDGNGDPITTTTDANGYYAFNGLNPGEYKVMFVAPDGFDFTTANAGSDDALDSDANPANGMTQTVTLTSGEFDGSLDAGLVLQRSSLGDRVWYDTDRDGIQDADEQGVQGVKVTLTGGGADGVIGTSDDTTATTTTDANGHYKFENLNSGEEYKVTFSHLPNGYEFTTPNVGSNDAVDSDVIPSSTLVKESIFIANAGFEADNLPYNSNHTVGHISGWDVNSPRAGAWNVHPYSYSGEAPEGDAVAYIDNGGAISQTLAETFEAGNSYELSFAVGDERYAGNSSGWEARLYAGGTLLGSVSNADFNPGDDTFVTAKLQLDADALQAYSSAYGEQLKIEFYDNGLAANVHFDDVKLTKEFHTSDATGMTQTVTLAPGEHNPTLDAGLVKSVGSLSGTVFHDDDCNGLETSETVIVHEDYTNGADAGWWDRWVMQRHNGDKYLGGFGNTYRTTDDTAKTFNVPAGTEKLKVEFDFLEIDSWDGEHFYAFVDGQRIDLGKFFVDYNYGNRTEGQSGQAGNISWTVSNEYTTQNFAGSGYSDEVHKVTLQIDNPGAQVRLGFGSSLNQNKHDESWGVDNLKITAISNKPQGKAGVQVTLLDAYGNEVLDANGNAITTTTNADGDYHFNNLAVGDYRVKVDAPYGKGFTEQNVGTDDTIDSDVDANGVSDVFTVFANQDTGNVDAGLKDLKASIGDRVWYDNNRNGIQDAGEEGVANVEVQLRTPDLQLIDTVRTDANGYYTFDNLTPGDYRIAINEATLPNDFAFTVANQGTNDGVDSDVINSGGWMDVTTLSAGEHDRSWDAGLVKKAFCAKLVGTENIHEGNKGNYFVELDHASDVDRYFTVQVNHGSAKMTTDYRASHQDIMWGGYYDTRDRWGRVIKKAYGYIAQGRAGYTGDDRKAVGPGDASWDYTVYDQNGQKDDNGIIQVKVAAGQTKSEAFHVQTWKERVTVDRDSPNNYGYYEGTENFSVNLVGGDADQLCGDRLHVNVYDRTHYDFFSPIALDLNGDGVQTTAMGATQGTFDLMGTGAGIESGWLSGQDAFLAVDNNGNGIIDNISELFGGEVGEGFAKLATYDTNRDSLVDADEILSGGLMLWQDRNENHFTDVDELISLASQGIESLSTTFEEIPIYQYGNLLLEHGVANRIDGSQIDMVDAYFQVPDTMVNSLSTPEPFLV